MIRRIKTYEQYVFESSEVPTAVVSVEKAVNAISEVFDDTMVSSVDSVYEEDGDELKLVITMTNVMFDRTKILYTKIIFWTDKEKKNVTRDYFKYLRDINCQFEEVKFEDHSDLVEKLKDIFSNIRDHFGDDILNLSGFMVKPATLLNEWLEANGAPGVNVTNVKYEPKVKSMPCKSLFFSFVISVNEQEIGLTITKLEQNVYRYTFKQVDETTNEEEHTMRSIVQTIGGYLKNNIR